ncbi:restriction endonuclease subunit S [Bacillus andreraoultii]|uniref:restriction endonuclease subunit S n=1 Tax=Bacillus andreraoultii TaxID=1499685 RepID=UPI00067E7F07|nr:restriction endonuclease subunit S [Bacillus andreraoultii]
MTTISRIREKVLEQAMRGKLVPQNNDDEDASILLEQIQAEKKKLIERKIIKKQKSLSSIEQDDIPYVLPKGWIWVRLSDISIVKGGKRIPKGYSFSEQATEHVYIRVTDMKNGTVSLEDLKYIDEVVFQQIKNYTISTNDLYLTIAGTIGRVGTIPKELNEMSLTENACKITPILVDLIYMKYLLSSELIQKQFREGYNQLAQPKLSLRTIESTIVPLPPLSEQKRIVTKIEDLLSICDQLENEVKFQQRNIQNLREKVLDDALKGLSVPQNEEDESADILFENIQAKKEKLVKSKVIGKSKPLSPIEEKEKPYELPKGWTWVKLGDLSKVIHYGYTASATDKNTGVRMVRITDIQDDAVNWDNVPYCEIEEKSIEKYDLKDNDILIARTGGTVGKSFIVEDAKYLSVFASYLIRVQLMDGVNPKYVKRFLESKLYWDQIVSQAKGTGQPNVNATGLSNLILPFPPIEEQHRIVEKVNTVWETINEIEDNIVKAK